MPARRRRGGPRPGIDPGLTRRAIATAAAEAFSRRGFDGITVDGIAQAAGVNKAMIYYHFEDKLALYREIVSAALTALGERISEIAASLDTPAAKIERFVHTIVALTEQRPYMPSLLMREIAEGAPHLDLETLGRMRVVFAAFGRILQEGQTAGAFREVHPVLAYITIMAPLVFNAARERAATQPERAQLPMFAQISHEDLTRHMQRVALRMLQKD